MSLDETAAGLVDNTAQDSGGFLSDVDARSNGAFNAGPWVYAKFTTDGLTKVELSDDG